MRRQDAKSTKEIQFTAELTELTKTKQRIFSDLRDLSGKYSSEFLGDLGVLAAEFVLENRG